MRLQQQQHLELQVATSRLEQKEAEIDYLKATCELKDQQIETLELSLSATSAVTEANTNPDSEGKRKQSNAQIASTMNVLAGAEERISKLELMCAEKDAEMDIMTADAQRAKCQLGIKDRFIGNTMEIVDKLEAEVSRLKEENARLSQQQ
eukprot:GFYU01027460.1.p1 GENE.GFYU01027460.1~~GFYU01027460.1.p1  ORF type:complete len:150 (-),score=47.77 GFYU01027460.1:90-539(-)